MKRISYVIIPIALVFLFGTAPVYATDIDSKISETKDVVQKLLQIKDDTSLDSVEREKLELQLKKTIVESILKISELQMDNAKGQLDAVSFPESDDWREVKSFLYESLDSHRDMFAKTKESLKSDSISLDSIKEIAKNLEDEKIGEVDIFLKRVTNVSVAFNISDILKLTEERLKKVSSDVDKIYAQKLSDNEELRNLFRKAAQEVGDARTRNNQTKEIMLHLYTKEAESATGTPADDYFMAAFLKNVGDFVKNTDTSSTSSFEETNISKAQKEEYLQNIIKQSAEYVRDAYSTFIQMSLSVKGLIKE